MRRLVLAAALLIPCVASAQNPVFQSLTTSGPAVIGGTLGVTGAATIGGTLNVTGPAVIGGNLSVTGNISGLASSSTVTANGITNTLATWMGYLPNGAPEGSDPTGVADSTTAILNAIAALPATGGHVPVCGKFKISSTIVVGNGSATAASSRNNVFLDGCGSTGPFGTADIGTTLVWAGPAGGTMVQFLGAENGGGLTGGWILDGAGIAATDLDVVHLQGGEFGQIKLKGATGTYLKLRTQTSPDPTGGVRNNHFGLLTFDTVQSGAIGISCDGLTTLAADCLQNTFDRVDMPIAGNGAIGIQLGFADFNRFSMVDISKQSAGTTSVGVKFVGTGPVGNTVFPSLNSFGSFASEAPSASDTTGGTPYGNNIDLYDVADSVPVPTNVGWGVIVTSSAFGSGISMSGNATIGGSGYTVSALPTCNTAARGTHTFVSDFTGTATFMAAIGAGGGSTYMPTWCNGSAWVQGG